MAEPVTCSVQTARIAVAMARCSAVVQASSEQAAKATSPHIGLCVPSARPPISKASVDAARGPTALVLGEPTLAPSTYADSSEVPSATKVYENPTVCQAYVWMAVEALVTAVPLPPALFTLTPRVPVCVYMWNVGTAFRFASTYDVAVVCTRIPRTHDILPAGLAVVPLRSSMPEPPSRNRNVTASQFGPFGQRLALPVTGPPPSVGYAANASRGPPPPWVPDEPPSGPRQKASAPMSPPTAALTVAQGSVDTVVTHPAG